MMFFIAHLVAFKLYLPSRYREFSIPIATSIGSGIVLTVIVGSIPNRDNQRLNGHSPQKGLFVIASMLLIASLVVLYPGVLIPI
jgi:hypothetical protein